MKAQSPASDTCLGLVEIDSIPAGLRATDALIKEASVRVLVARPVTPGKYVTLFEGEVEAVERARGRAAEVAGGRLVGDLVLPRPHEQLVEGLLALRGVEEVDALGVVETTTIAAAIIAADGALKTGEVELVEIRLAMGLGGRAFFTVAGEVSSVEVAVERACELASRAGALHDSTVIAQPDADTIPHVIDPTPPFSDLAPPAP